MKNSGASNVLKDQREYIGRKKSFKTLQMKNCHIVF